MKFNIEIPAPCNCGKPAIVSAMLMGLDMKLTKHHLCDKCLKDMSKGKCVIDSTGKFVEKKN